MDDSLGVPEDPTRTPANSAGFAGTAARVLGIADAAPSIVMGPLSEDDDDPKKSRPVHVAKKREDSLERSEARKDHERDGHRHVNVRC